MPCAALGQSNKRNPLEDDLSGSDFEWFGLNYALSVIPGMRHAGIAGFWRRPAHYWALRAKNPALEGSKISLKPLFLRIMCVYVC
jgi:hypothetical protein